MTATAASLSIELATIAVIYRLRPIPEFTDTTDTDTLDLQRHRYRVPGSDVIAASMNVVSRQCVSTEQACAVHVCVVLQKIL